MSKRIVTLVVITVMVVCTFSTQAGLPRKLKNLHASAKNKLGCIKDKVEEKEGYASPCPNVTLKNAVIAKNEQFRLRYTGIYKGIDYSVMTQKRPDDTRIEISFAESMPKEEIRLDSILRKIKKEFQIIEWNKPLVDEDKLIYRIYLIGK